MAKQIIKIRDLKLFSNSLKSFNKLANEAKFQVNSEGLTIYGKNSFARGEFFTDSVYSDADIEFCLNDISMFIKIIGTALEVHENDGEDIDIFFDQPFIKVESKKFKTKYITMKEDIIVNSIAQKIKTALTPVFEFVTSSNQIKYINQHSYITNDPTLSRIYLEMNKDMENNVVYARIGNDNDALNNTMTLKIGLVTSGSIENRKLIINFDRLALFNIVPSDEIKIQLMDKNVLVNTIQETGKNDSKYKFTIYTSLLAN